MPYLFQNAMVWSDGRASPGDVLVDGSRIAAVLPPGSGPDTTQSTTIFDVEGATLLPGLIDGHAHLGFAGDPRDWATLPIEEHVLRCMHNAETLLNAGITGIVSGGAFKPRLDIVIRNEINAGLIPGPRM